MKRRNEALKVGRNWIKFDCCFSTHLEKCCKMVGLPSETDIEEILNHFRIKDVTAIDEADSRIICETPQDKVTIIFLNSITFRERGEIWIENKTGCRKYAVVPETQDQPWYTIYLGSNMSFDGEKNLLTHLDENAERRSVGKWEINQNKKDILKVSIETFEYRLYNSTQEIETCLQQYLQADAELDVWKMYCELINSLPEGLENAVTINITVWDDKQREIGKVLKDCGSLREFITISGEEIVTIHWTGTWIWRKGKESVSRIGTGYTNNQYKIEAEINSNEIQNAGNHVTELIEQAERTVNNYMPLFK